MALASVERLEAGLSAITPPDYEVVRGPETGLVMIRGRVGNTGDAFNVGEALATRCVVSLKDGCLGYAWVLGEDARRAELAALYDALWQREGYAEALDRELLPELEAERAAGCGRMPPPSSLPVLISLRLSEEKTDAGLFSARIRYAAGVPRCARRHVPSRAALPAAPYSRSPCRTAFRPYWRILP